MVKNSAHHGVQMDAIYRTQRHFYDLTRKYYLLGRDQLIADMKPPENAHILEIGCGTGRNIIAAAKHYPDTQFYGLDISEAMLEMARKNIEKAGVADRVMLKKRMPVIFQHRKFSGAIILTAYFVPIRFP